jgi:hypothetical protein
MDMVQYRLLRVVKSIPDGTGDVDIGRAPGILRQVGYVSNTLCDGDGSAFMRAYVPGNLSRSMAVVIDYRFFDCFARTVSVRYRRDEMVGFYPLDGREIFHPDAAIAAYFFHVT